MGQGSLFLCPIRKAGYGQATSPIMPIKFNKSMAQLNGNYLNGTNIAVLGTSAHETSEIMVYEHPLFGKVRMFIKCIICHAFEQFYCTAYPKSSAEAFGSGLG